MLPTPPFLSQAPTEALPLLLPKSGSLKSLQLPSPHPPEGTIGTSTCPLKALGRTSVPGVMSWQVLALSHWNSYPQALTISFPKFFERLMKGERAIMPVMKGERQLPKNCIPCLLSLWIGCRSPVDASVAALQCTSPSQVMVLDPSRMGGIEELTAYCRSPTRMQQWLLAPQQPPP